MLMMPILLMETTATMERKKKKKRNQNQSHPPPKFCWRRRFDPKERTASCVASRTSLTETYIACGYLDKTVRFFDSETFDEKKLCAGAHKRLVTCMVMSNMGPNGEDPIVASGCKDGSVCFWDPDTYALIATLQFPVNEVRCLSIFQGREIYMMIGSRDSQVIIWDLKNSRMHMDLKGHKGCVHAVYMASFCPEPEIKDPLDYLCVASGATDRSCRLWNIKTGKRRRKLRHEHSVLAVSMASHGIEPMVVTGGVEKIIRVWDYESGLQLMCLTGHIGMVNALTIFEDAMLLVISASADRTVRVFDLISGEMVCTLIGHENDVRDVALSNHNKLPMVISTSEDRTVAFWNLDEIARTFYHVVEDLPNHGMRNDTPAYNPAVDYIPPPEKVYTEEELAAKAKRRAAKEEKKRLKTLAKLQLSGDAANDDMDGELEEDPLDIVGGEDTASSKPAKPSKSKNKGKRHTKDDEDDYNEDADGEGGEEYEEEVEEQVQGKESEARAAADTVPADAAESTSLIRTKSKGSGMLAKTLSFLNSLGTSNRVHPDPMPDEPQSQSNIDAQAAEPGEAAEDDNAEDPEDSQQPTDTAAPLGKGPAVGRDNHRQKATRMLDSFARASVENKLDLERKKTKAQEKLQERLNKRKGIVSDEKEDNYEVIRAQKLREHKLHDDQLQQNLALAQKRSNDLLKKRILEAKIKQALNPIQTNSDSEDEDAAAVREENAAIKAKYGNQQQQQQQSQQP